MSLFLDTFLPPFKRHLAYAKFYKCLPFEWEEKRNKFKVNATIANQILIHTWTLLTGAYVGFQIVNVIYGRHPLADKLVAVLILEFYTICFGIGLEFEPDTAPIQNLNRLLCKKGECWLTIVFHVTHKIIYI